jgi:hypothetical protein
LCLFSRLLKVRLHQGGKAHIWFIKQTIQGCASLSSSAFGLATKPKASLPYWWPL